ncbi:MAG: hypothetical protein AB1832_02330 [Pseudomonadota bacterium]
MSTILNDEKNWGRCELQGLDRAFEILIAGLVGTSLCGLGMAAIGLFRAPQALLLGIAAAICYALVTRRADEPVGGFRIGRCTLHLAAIVMVGIFFRLPAVDYVSGGQDQGVYVNIASHIVRTGGFAIQDDVIKSISDKGALEKYSSDNHPKTTDFLLGIFYKGAPDSGNLEFQFYHLFPVWMAVFGGLFGLNASVSALTFLAILSLIFFYRLALEVTGRPALALLAGMLLALNPLHAFFSRFPVTELPTLCFTLSGFWLVLSAWHRAGAENVRGKVLLSLLAFACAFLIRVSGFMYIPTFILIGIVACVFESRSLQRRMIVGWVAGCLFVYAVTVAYGLGFSKIYVSAMYRLSFAPLLGAHWRLIVGAISVALCLLVALMYFFSEQLSKAVALRSRLGLLRGWIGLVALVVLVPWAVRIHSLGFTEKYLSDAVLGKRWHIAGLGFGVLKYSSLIVASEYLGPFMLAAFFLLAWKRQFSAPITILLSFVVSFLIYVCVLQWVVPYQPYYARYLASEFVPYLLLFVVAASPYVVSRLSRRLLQVAFGATLLYGGILSCGQLRAHAQEGMDASYARIAQHVGDRDLLLLDISSLVLPDQLIEMPLMLRFGRNVARITEPNLGDSEYLNVLQKNYDDLFLLSGSPVAPPGFDMVSSVRLRELVAAQGSKPPLYSQVRFNGRTFLYVRHGASILPGDLVLLNSATIGQSGGGWRKMLVSGWSRPEAWGVWSDQPQALLRVPARLGDGSRPQSLVLNVRGFLTDHHRQQQLHVSVNGVGVLDTVLNFPSPGDVKLIIPLPSNVREREGYNIELSMPDAVSPAELGIGDDTRALAIGLVSASLNSGQ